MSVILEFEIDKATDDDPDFDDHSSDESSFAVHSLCRNATNVADLQRVISIITVETASIPDRQGRTPLHALSENHALSQSILACGAYPCRSGALASPSQRRTSASPYSRAGPLDRAASVTSTSSSSTSIDPRQTMKLVSEVVELLWRAYPPAMMTTDSKGQIPFESALREWVDVCYVNEASTTHPRPSCRSLTSTIYDAPASILPSFWELKDSVVSRWANVGAGYQRNGSKRTLVADPANHQRGSTAPSAHSNDVEAGGEMPPTATRDRIFPRHVRMTEHAMFSLEMLSMLLDRMDAMASCETGNGSDYSSRKRKMRGRSLLDQLQLITVKEMSMSIVYSVSCIPDLLKSCLFVEDTEQRDQCLGTTLMISVLTSKHSVGSWLTGMLQGHNKQATDLALEYLRIVSNASSGDNGSGMSDPKAATMTSLSSKKRFEDAKRLQDEFYEEISHLQEFVPSLLSLCEMQIEEAATTKVVQQALDRIISRPFAVTVVFCDALFLIFLISGYRGAINGVLLGMSHGSVLRYIYLANIGTFYFVIREIGKAISFCMITRRARVYITFWNFVDLATTILALVSTIAIRSLPFPGLRGLCAVTTGFMWLRVLSYLKGINMQLATFVLAILQVRATRAFVKLHNWLPDRLRSLLLASLLRTDCQRPSLVCFYSFRRRRHVLSNVLYFVGAGRVLS